MNILFESLVDGSPDAESPGIMGGYLQQNMRWMPHEIVKTTPVMPEHIHGSL